MPSSRTLACSFALQMAPTGCIAGRAADRRLLARSISRRTFVHGQMRTLARPFLLVRTAGCVDEAGLQRLPTSTSRLSRCRGRGFYFRHRCSSSPVVARHQVQIPVAASRIAGDTSARRGSVQHVMEPWPWDHDYALGPRDSPALAAIRGACCQHRYETSSKGAAGSGQNVFASGMEIVDKAGDGKVIAAFRMCPEPLRAGEPCAGPVSEHVVRQGSEARARR